MAYFDCQHHQLFIANFAKHAIITDAIAPFARMIGHQALPERTRILAPVNILSSQDTMTRRTCLMGKPPAGSKGGNIPRPIPR